MSSEHLDSDTHAYVPELEEYSEEELEALSPDFWRRLTYAKQLYHELKQEGVAVRPKPVVEDEKSHDISLGMVADNTGDEWELIEHPMVEKPLAFDWEDAPPVLNLVSSVGGEVVGVDMWKHGKLDEGILGIKVRFPHLYD